MSSTLKPLTLHAHSTGPNPYKIAAALEFLSIPYTVKLWQFGEGPNGVKGPNFLPINPNGRVPAVEDPNTGVTSWESGAIMNYILRVYDKENKLGPRGTSEQDRVDFEKWEYFLLSTLGPMMGQVNWFTHYNSTKNEDARKRYEVQAYRNFEVLDGQLSHGDGDFILPGATPTAVDLHFYPWVRSYEYAQLSLESYPNVKKWVAGMKELKEIKAAYEKISEGEAM
ncbi:related to Glutathione S-transferase II [Ramularia collo-cygni]|uniref:Related to Glutathione S-transferase II n=1 Tax=Ramularia collo-cygni TaxID=112498 RepID=A0A2D3VB24_9PEZI|nr:related to Glutathione S-transferase II [Ramularia collo-cygni]CZT24160.1 related to Glutathione S-transferase II [Ramularia collo-cygni]